MSQKSIENASSDFLAESEQRMLNSLPFCEFYLTFYQRQMANSVKNRSSARIYHEACKDLTVNTRSFLQKVRRFSVFDEGKSSIPSLPTDWEAWM